MEGADISVFFRLCSAFNSAPSKKSAPSNCLCDKDRADGADGAEFLGGGVTVRKSAQKEKARIDKGHGHCHQIGLCWYRGYSPGFSLLSYSEKQKAPHASSTCFL